MAPVSATTTGVPQQPIDDPDLAVLIDRLSSFDNSNISCYSSSYSSTSTSTSTSDNDIESRSRSQPQRAATVSEGEQRNDPGSTGTCTTDGDDAQGVVDMEGLVGELERVHEWRYKEQVRKIQCDAMLQGCNCKFCLCYSFSIHVKSNVDLF